MKPNNKVLKRAKKLLKMSMAEDGTIVQARVHAVIAAIKRGPDSEKLSTLRAYRKLIDQAIKRKQVQVTTAIDLDASAKNRMVTYIEKQFGSGTESMFTVDPELISGVKITTFDTVIDDTVKGRFEQMKNTVSR